MLKKYKKMIICPLLLTLVACSYVDRKDMNQKITFQSDSVVKGLNEITIYKIGIKSEKDYQLLERYFTKSLANNTQNNYLISKNLYDSLQQFGGRKSRDNSVYEKHSFDLTESDKEILDREIEIKFELDSGINQKYLNKQVYYWLKKLEKENTFDADNYYSELDKELLIDEYIGKLSNVSKIFFESLNKNNLMIELKNREELLQYKLSYPVYINFEGYTKEELEGVNSKIIMLNNNKNSIVLFDKLILINNGNTKTVKEHSFKTIIKNLELENFNQIKSKVLLNDLSQFKEINTDISTEKKAVIDEKVRERTTIKINKNNEWGIE